MADNKNMNDGRDASKVDANDHNEVEHVHTQFPHHTHEDIKDAIAKAGPLRADIYAHLEKKGKK